MNRLIEALQIFLKYDNPSRPTHCEHDVLMVMCRQDVSEEDAARLDELGFMWSDEPDRKCWISFRYGSA